MKPIWAAMVFLWVLMCGSAVAQDPSKLILAGKLLSEKHCARCHVVDPEKPFTGISSTPSFKLLVTALDDWEDRFSSFHARLPHQSIVRFEGEDTNTEVQDLRPPVEIRYEDIDALVAYARSLLKQ